MGGRIAISCLHLAPQRVGFQDPGGQLHDSIEAFTSYGNMWGGNFKKGGQWAFKETLLGTGVKDFLIVIKEGTGHAVQLCKRI